MSRMSSPLFRLSRPFRILAGFLLLLGIGVAFVSSALQKAGEPRPRGPKKITTPKGEPVADTKKTWVEVDKLIADQQLEAASKLVMEIREKAEAKGDEAIWTSALIREVQLRTALHGYETSVRFLRSEPWPKGPLSRVTLELFYGHSLVTYQQAYSWEIGQREKVEAKGEVDLKAWSGEQIREEAARAYARAWQQREALGKEPVARLSEFLETNSYPPGIRGTLRDAVSYLFVEFLADTAGWRPEQSNDLFQLDLPSLIAGDAQREGALKLDDPAIHPLLRIGAILTDLEQWNDRDGEREAALEARLERLRRLHASFTKEADRGLIRKDLARRLASFKQLPWWAMGQAELAEFVRQEPVADNLVRARALAVAGSKAFPESPGALRCLAIIDSIEAPDYQLAAMSSDGLSRRSILVTHRNMASITFRAYPVDLEKRVTEARDYNLFPSGPELVKLVHSRAAAEWTVQLPPTPDFKSHRTFVTPPQAKPGFYIVASSARSDFGTEKNRILSVGFVLSDLVLLTRRDVSGAYEVSAVSGETGRPLPDTSVALYRYDWQSGHEKVETRTTDAQGTVRFEFAGGRNGASHFVLARHADDPAIDPQFVSFYKQQEATQISASLVYTDRSIYRPLQKIFWKVVAYEGRAPEGKFRTRPQVPVTMWLVDPNGERVETKTVTTNDFGSAAGEFTIPAGRVLGHWRLDSSLQGNAALRVEEYKRPTFEVHLLDPKSVLRLNRPATLTGDVKYYFGLPVVNGSVKWRVTREPVYPWWYWWWRPQPSASGAQTIAFGTSKLAEDGTFNLTFTPAADETSAGKSPEAMKGVSFRYSVVADVTDEGGETRSATRAFRLGLVAVEAVVANENGFLRDGIAGELKIRRSDLDGVGRAGSGRWRLVRLQQPAAAQLPADRPVSALTPVHGDEDGSSETTDGTSMIQTPGDSLRSRWERADAPERILHDWKDGAEVAKGSVDHDSKGEAGLVLPKLAAGAYRIHYETMDDFGARFETASELIVAADRTPLALPAALLVESSSVAVGGTARILVHSGLVDQPMLLDIYRGGKLVERRRLQSGKSPALIEFPIGPSDRGGFGVSLTAVRDHQLMQFSQSVFVPWEDKELHVEFATFRDRIRPGTKETWKVIVKGGKGSESDLDLRSAELLAYMYDKSLDLFGPHQPPTPISLYPQRTQAGQLRSTLGQAPSQWVENSDFASVRGYPTFSPDRLKFLDGYGIGGPGARGGTLAFNGAAVRGGMAMRSAAPSPMSPAPAMMAEGMVAQAKSSGDQPKEVDKLEKKAKTDGRGDGAAPDAPVTLRSDFSETAFWRPNLLTDAAGTSTFEFTVPDSVTAWNVWVHALTRDLRSGSIHKETQSVKELMVRPYLPRFLREGDRAELKVVVNNASDKTLSGRVAFEILDPETNASLNGEFGLDPNSSARPFAVAKGGSANLTFPITAPKRVGPISFKVTAVAGDTSDGELRSVPLLPGRIHLVQSRFVTLRNATRKELRFDDLARNDDPTLVNDQMVVTVDAQLFYSVLQALPYLVNYPYECAEQTLNRFVSSGIVSSLYSSYPAIGKMAETMSKRETPLESWAAADPNRKMSLEETPWLEMARGGKDAGHGLTNVLDPRVAKADRDGALAKLRKMQTSIGAFPWWPGGPPSPYMTLYVMYGFAKASEFGVEVPRDMVTRGWTYLASHYRNDLRSLMAKDCCWEFLTFMNYVATCYPDPSWMGDALTESERKEILAFSFKHWREHSPYLKGYLALTLKRMGRPADAQKVWASVMDSAKTNEEQGTFWAAEDRSWLWYNDTTETHAFALRTLMELSPEDSRKDGLVQWLLLDKKLNQWKSTRATAEVIYSLVHYLKKEGALGIREDATVTIGPRKVSFTFEPDVYSGGKNQIVVPGPQVDPKTMSTVIVEKQSKGFAFASATWHFSTEKLPAEERGDFFRVSRSYFKREHVGREFTLKPLVEGETLHPGDEVEVHLSLKTKHAAEYVHLRDPRAAGLEPENVVSGIKWDLGIVWYEETRDSGTNFFFEQLPAGEYPFKYRLRVNMAGTFKVGPATVQSMYAPEFNAYSSGATLTVAGEK